MCWTFRGRMISVQKNTSMHAYHMLHSVVSQRFTHFTRFLSEMLQSRRCNLAVQLGDMNSVLRYKLYRMISDLKFFHTLMQTLSFIRSHFLTEKGDALIRQKFEPSKQIFETEFNSKEVFCKKQSFIYES